MNDDTAPAWADALLQVMNDQFDQLDANLDNLGGRLDRIADKMDKNADELEQANTILDRMIASMAGHTPEGRG